MQERINRLKRAIAELRERARRCDPDFGAQFHALANEMQQAVDEMQEKLSTASASQAALEQGASGYDLDKNEVRARRHQKLGKLLLVEDEPTLRGLLAEFLEEEGFDVLQASGCAAAMKCLDLEPQIDCVLSDVRMPDGNGFALAQSILNRRPKAKVALISGYSEQLPDTLAKKGVQLFRKPLPLADLAMHVKDLCTA